MESICSGKYTALQVAKYIIQTVHKMDGSISNLKLQKVLYLVQARFLVSTGKGCFYDPIIAWQIGPVVPAVYHEYAAFLSASIPCTYKDTPIWIAPNDAKLINEMIDFTWDMSVTYLTWLTQNQTPWMKTPTGHPINPQEIYEFFKEAG